jgi:hypothetical protein
MEFTKQKVIKKDHVVDLIYSKNHDKSQKELPECKVTSKSVPDGDYTDTRDHDHASFGAEENSFLSLTNTTAETSISVMAAQKTIAKNIVKSIFIPPLPLKAVHQPISIYKDKSRI